MDIATAKEMLGKASGWAMFSYVETKTEKEANGEKTIETRYELNCYPKKVTQESDDAIGEWIIKLMPYLTIIVIAWTVIKLLANQ